MGLGGLVTGIMGATGNSPTNSAPNPYQVGGDYMSMLKSYLGGSKQVFQNDASWLPQYAALRGNVGTQMIGSLRSANPAVSSLYDTLSKQAGEGLAAGSNLDPALAQVFQQSTRGGQAARGLGFGPSDALQESVSLTQLGNQLRQQRQQFAQGVATQQTQELTLPGMQLGGSAGPSLTSPGQQYDMYNTAYNATAGANIGNQNAKTAMLSGFNSFD